MVRMLFFGDCFFLLFFAQKLATKILFFLLQKTKKNYAATFFHLKIKITPL
jgi:hypothetical protein